MKFVVTPLKFKSKGITVLEAITNQTKSKSPSLVVVCAWCQRQRVLGPDLNFYWVEMKKECEYAHVTHTICPTCKDKVSNQLHIIP